MEPEVSLMEKSLQLSDMKFQGKTKEDNYPAVLTAAETGGIYLLTK